MHPEGPATGHLHTGFLGFPLSLNKYGDGSQVPGCLYMLLMQHCLCKFIKITPIAVGWLIDLTFQITSTFSNNSIKQNSAPLSQAFTTHHPNVFTVILSLSEGRAGVAWVPSSKMLFRPDIKRLSLSPKYFLLTSTLLLSSLSLSVGSKS
jgi:hypothetical protein